MTIQELMAALKADPKLYEQLKTSNLDEELTRNLPTYIASGRNGAGAVQALEYICPGSVAGQAVRICKLGPKLNRDGTPFVPSTRKKPAAAPAVPASNRRK